MPADPQRARELFLHAVGKLPPEQWDGFVAEACPGDAELERQVRHLLQVHREAGSFLELPAVPGVIEQLLGQALTRPMQEEPAGGDGEGVSLEFLTLCADDLTLRECIEALLRAQAAAGEFPGPPARCPIVTIQGPPIGEAPGTAIGPYKLMERIGEGGMGTVWMAQQTEPVRRLVAVKLIKAGMDSRQVIARFEAERQTLALMDHPNIARVLDAGTTDAGRPYFVMDLVTGVPITRYCDEQQLTPRQRLELFIPVCQAVQHAHQKGIIHRDLKPSNVLVTLYDGKPVPKVIDFGVAKVLGQSLTDKTLVTGCGNIVGTLEYMSPEQAELDQLDIDTRSDIYSLGVLLYELLAGSPPFTNKELERAGILEMLRVIREQEPSRPSMKLSTAEGLPTLAANRGTEPAKLTKLVRGELDWIVMKALEKDRGRRYETAIGFAMDVKRCLADEPVLACPPSVGYRIRKFVRRNKTPVVAAAVVLLTLVAGVIGTTVGLVRAEQARRKEAERAAGERRAQQEAQVREAETKAVLDFVEKRVLTAADPEGQDGGLGHDVTLRRAVEAALPFVDVSFVDRPLIEARLRITLGISFDHLGDAKRAQEQFEKARVLFTKHRGPDHSDTLDSMVNLATSYDDLGRHAEAFRLREEVLALREAKLGPDHHEMLARMSNLADRYAALGRHAEALTLRKQIVGLQKEQLGPDDLHTLDNMNKLANSYYELGRHAEALTLREEGLARMKAKLGVHPFTLRRMYTLALSYAALGRDAEAVRLWKEALALQQANLGPEHPDTLASQRAIRDVQTLLKLQEAVRLRPEDAEARNILAGEFLHRGRLSQAEAEAREAVRLQPDLALAHYNLGAILYRRDQVDGAEAAFREATRLKPDWAWLRFIIGDAYARFGRWDRAVAAYNRGLELDPSMHWEWFRAAALCLQVGDLPAYRRACGEMLERFSGETGPEIAERTARACGLAPGAVGNFGRVEELAERAVLESEKQWWYRYAVLAKGLTEYRAGRPAGAAEWLKRYAPREEDRSCGMQAFALLAMAQHRLGNAAEARAALTAAAAFRAARMPDPANGRPFDADWHDWLMAEALYREAEALLPKGPGAGPGTREPGATCEPKR